MYSTEVSIRSLRVSMSKYPRTKISILRSTRNGIQWFLSRFRSLYPFAKYRRRVERRLSTRRYRGYRWRSLPETSGLLANGRPCRRRRRFCQTRRSLRGSHVNVCRAARKRVRRVSAKRSTRSGRGDTRRGDVRGAVRRVEGHEDPRRDWQGWRIRAAEGDRLVSRTTPRKGTPGVVVLE